LRVFTLSFVHPVILTPYFLLVFMIAFIKCHTKEEHFIIYPSASFLLTL